MLSHIPCHACWVFPGFVAPLGDACTVWVFRNGRPGSCAGLGVATIGHHRELSRRPRVLALRPAAALGAARGHAHPPMSAVGACWLLSLCSNAPGRPSPPSPLPLLLHPDGLVGRQA
eukprot:14720245-Alexandrium_andersonii.AAC.1